MRRPNFHSALDPTSTNGVLGPPRNDKLSAHYGAIERGLFLIAAVDGYVEKPEVMHVTPYSMQINILNGCFQKCIGCRKPEWPDVQLTYEEVRELLLWLSKRRANNTVVFSGGDPTAHKDFPQMVKTAKAFGLGVGVLTAGLWGKSFPAEKVWSQVDWVSVSVDGASPEVYEKMRGVDTLMRVSDNVKLMVRYCKNVRVNATIGKDNFHEMADIIRLAHYWNVRQCNLFPIHTWPELKLQNVKESTLIREIDRAFDWAAGYPIETNIGSFAELLVRKPPRICVVPVTHSFVDANGDVFVCCRGANDNGNHAGRHQDAILGNIRTETVDGVFTSERARKVWDTTRLAGHSFCKGCDRYASVNQDYYMWLRSRREQIYL